MDKINVGIIGCGNISGVYIKNFVEVYRNVTLYAVSDLLPERTQAVAEQYGITNSMTAEEMIASPEISIIVNLTTPPYHYALSKQALCAGKHVYVEKPLSLSLEEGKELVSLAEEKGLLLGCAPDTFLGAGLQTCRKAVDDGLVGDILGASAFMLCHGHESWHPDPAFYYQKGGGPMFDMGPYYLTALVSLAGPVASVMGMTATSFPERVVTSEKRFGERITVEVPTHVNGLMRFANGAVGNIVTTFDVWGSTLPRIELYGTRGTLVVPDPNGFGGEVLLKQPHSAGFEPLPLISPYVDQCRGLGVCDMADCLLTGRTDNRASGKLACHVLEIMHAFHTSSDEKREIALSTSCERPEPLPITLTMGCVR